MENNNGRGIFYGVIGVATLIVAIIGATFAYFSASTEAENVLESKSATVSLSLINEDSNYKNLLVPVESEAKEGYTNESGKALFNDFISVDDTVAEGNCIDKVGKHICSVYTFEVQNPTSSTDSVTITGNIKSTSNGFQNLNYVLFRGLASEIEAGVGYDVNGKAVDSVGQSTAAGSVVVAKTALPTQGTTQPWAVTTETLAPGQSAKYTIVAWLEETGQPQDEQGKTYAATISFGSDNGSVGGVTGVLSLSQANG